MSLIDYQENDKELRYRIECTVKEWKPDDPIQYLTKYTWFSLRTLSPLKAKPYASWAGTPIGLPFDTF